MDRENFERDDELFERRPRARAEFVRSVVDTVPASKQRGARSVRATVALVMTAGLLASFAGLAYSAAGGNGNGNSGGTRPGWGCGDRNHTHTGPPGNQYGTNPCPPGSPGNP